MRYIIGFFRFWYDFVIGDCWQIALGVALVLGCGALLARAEVMRSETLAPAIGLGIVLVVVISLLTTTKVRAR